MVNLNKHTKRNLMNPTCRLNNYVCVCIIVSYTTPHRTDNQTSGNHHTSDAVCWRGGGPDPSYLASYLDSPNRKSWLCRSWYPGREGSFTGHNRRTERTSADTSKPQSQVHSAFISCPIPYGPAAASWFDQWAVDSYILASKRRKATPR